MHMLVYYVRNEYKILLKCYVDLIFILNCTILPFTDFNQLLHCQLTCASWYDVKNLFPLPTECI